jgi:hypothetical protein
LRRCLRGRQRLEHARTGEGESRFGNTEWMLKFARFIRSGTRGCLGSVSIRGFYGRGALLERAVLSDPVLLTPLQTSLL